MVDQNFILEQGLIRCLFLSFGVSEEEVAAEVEPESIVSVKGFLFFSPAAPPSCS